MKETDQKVVDMTLEEFRKWEIPNGYRVVFINGDERYGVPGSLDTYVHMRVLLEKK